MVFLFNRFRRGYRYSRKSVPAWIPIFQEFGSNVDTNIPDKFQNKCFETSLKTKRFLIKNVFFLLFLFRKSVPAWIPFPKEFGSGVDTDIPGNRLQCGRRYSRKSAPTWTPIFQEFGSSVDTESQDKDIGSGVNTESQRFEWASEDRKTKIRRVDFRRIDEPRFVSASRWIYRIRLSVLGFGYMEFGFRFLGLDIWVSTFGWALDIWISFGFDFWFLGFEYKDFGFRLLGVGYMGFVFRLLGVGYTGFDFQFSGFRYVSTFGWVLDIWVSFHFGFLVGFSFGLLLNGFLFRTLSDRVSRR
ncbi:unnamed protein product [Rhizophagus irregularis]|nr:unnamed protein product [Rhizophagus irregularis]